MSLLFSILIFFLILTFIITVHEFGHFLTAKKFGVYCKEFAIGMGKKVFSKQKGETEFSIRILPMGGFVQMVGEDGVVEDLFPGDLIWIKKDSDDKLSEITKVNPENESYIEAELVSFSQDEEPMMLTYKVDEIIEKVSTKGLVTYYDRDNQEQWLVAKNRQFTNIHPWKKIVVLTAGVLTNFFFGFVLIFAATWISGVNVEPVIINDGYAAEANNESFEVHDKIISIDGVSYQNVSEITPYIQANAGKKVEVKVARNDKEVVVKRTILEAQTQEVTKEGITNKSYGILGISYEKNHSNMWEILKTSFVSMIAMFKSLYFTIITLFTGKVSVKNLTGFVGIAQQTNAIIQMPTVADGMFSKAFEILGRICSFAAFLSINIGFMNILPIPALDGGRVVFAVYELITRRKANPKFEMYLNAFGFLLLIGIFILVTFQDVFRLFS